MWFLRKMAWPISLLYGFVVWLRNLLYDKELLKSKIFDVPIICVGNLSVGGTGKTPMIEFLIRELQDQVQLAVLSRGYKRQTSGFHLADVNVTVSELGDEPFQIYQKFPRVAVAVDVNRRNGIAELQKKVNPRLILLDDGFQHRKVKPSFAILLTTYSNPYFEDWFLPTGNLRDSKNAVKRADVIVVTKCPVHITEDKMQIFKTHLKPKADQLILFSTLVYDKTLYGHPSILSLKDLKEVTFTVVTGIANPKPLIDYLNNEHLVFEHLKFADHHQFSSSEITFLQNKTLVLTTEKDYMRLQGKVERICYVKVQHQFLKDGDALLLKHLHDTIT